MKCTKMPYAMAGSLNLGGDGGVGERWMDGRMDGKTSCSPLIAVGYRDPE